MNTVADGLASLSFHQGGRTRRRRRKEERAERDKGEKDTALKEAKHRKLQQELHRKAKKVALQRVKVLVAHLDSQKSRTEVKCTIVGWKQLTTPQQFTPITRNVNLYSRIIRIKNYI